MIYTIHMPPQVRSDAGGTIEDTRFDGLVAVPESGAKWALVFAPFWLVFHQLWWPLVIYLMIAVLALTLLATPFALAAIFLGGLPALYLFLEGHQLRRNKLEANGLPVVDIVDAADEREALERFLAGWQEPERVVRPDLPRASLSPPMPSFGMFPQDDH